jgi:hypothetical protein
MGEDRSWSSGSADSGSLAESQIRVPEAARRGTEARVVSVFLPQYWLEASGLEVNVAAEPRRRAHPMVAPIYRRPRLRGMWWRCI